MAGYSPENDKTAFGELKTATLTPVVQLQFPYNINTQIVKPNANQSGVVDVLNNMARLQSGAAADSSGELYSIISAKYNPGQGTLVRFTALFGAGVAGSEQHVGVGNHGDGFFFAQEGAAFGISYHQGGSNEVRTLTVDTVSDTSEDITITLDGDAKTDVAVTNQANKTVMANEIAAADYSDVGRGWDAYAVNDTVIFISWADGIKDGVYTLSGAAGTAAGTIVETLAGVTATEIFIAQADWNIDPMLGTAAGNSEVVLDPTKGNVYEIQYQWLGFGAILFSIEDPETGEFVAVHRVEYANANVIPSIDNPTLPLYAGSVNTTNTSNVILQIGSMMLGTEGLIEPHGYTHGIAVQDAPGTASEVPILSVRNKLIHQGRLNRVMVKTLIMAAGVEHNKTVSLNIYRGATLTSAAFADIDADTSVLQKDTTATAFTGGTLLLSLPLGRTGNTVVTLDRDDAGLLAPGEIFTVTAVPGSGTTHEVDFSLNLLEQF